MQNLLIGSTGKSGSHLLLSLLEGHEDFITFPEECNFLSFFEECVLRTGYHKGNTRPILELPAPKQFLFQRFYEIHLKELAAKFPECIDAHVWLGFINSIREWETIKLTEFVSTLRKVYLESIHSDESSAKYFVFKITESERLSGYSYLEDFKIIVLTRNPLALFNTFLQSSLGKGNNLVYSGGDSVKGTFERVVAQIFNEFFASFDSSTYFLLKYEDLCLDPRTALEALTTWLDVDWQDILLIRTKFGQPDYGYTEAEGRLVIHESNQINADSVSRFEKALSTRQKFLAHLLLQGYYDISAYQDYFQDCSEAVQLQKSSIAKKLLVAILYLLPPFKGEFTVNSRLPKYLVLYILRRFFWFQQIFRSWYARDWLLEYCVDYSRLKLPPDDIDQPENVTIKEPAPNTMYGPGKSSL